MSREVDSRVVEMRFDNKEFEKNASHSITTLGKLKEALKLPDSTKAIENLSSSTKNIKLDGIAAGIEALSNRFSTFGIVGMRVIENITDGLMGKLHQAISFVTNSIVSGGIKRAMNIENAHFQLQALLKDETKVQAVMANAMESVDGTAYAYDEAAKAASQFSASGIQAGEDMLGALKGITGVASMTNSSFEDISRIFTTVAGNGRLMGDQLLQLSGRGLNAASTLVDYFKEVKGQSGIMEGEIRNMVSKGKISFKDFSDAMTWAFGDSAKRANETFTGALSNMKSALARIGAGFISPLVEQNGELVKLFNALRIQINNVKSTLVFDEQQSVISGLSKRANLLNQTVSQFVKDGTIGFDKIATSILGTAKSEEELIGINEKLSELFDEVKTSGSASVGTLIAFKDNGINAVTAIQNYVNGVLDGTIKVSEEAKAAIDDISGGTKLVSSDITKLTQEGKISFDIFADAMLNASDVSKESSEVISETIKGLFSNVKKQGKVTVETLIEFNKNGMNAATALQKYMNGVADGSIRASYATKQAIDEITDGTKLVSGDIVKLAEEGKISFDIFQSAMEEAYGDSRALSKQFTDSFLDTIKTIVQAIENADFTKPMEAFYYWVETGKNLGKGLISILKPIAKAFKNVFLNIDMDAIVNFSAAIEELTAKMTLSEENSKELEDAFKGVFDVVKLLIDIFVKFVGVFVPINAPIIETGNGLLGLAGSAGRALSSFTNFIRRAPIIRSAYKGLSEGVSFTSEKVSSAIVEFKKFVKQVEESSEVKGVITTIKNSLEELANVKNPFARLNDTLFIFWDVIKKIDWNAPGKGIEKFKNILTQIKNLAMANEGFATFVQNAKDFGKAIKEAFSLDNVTIKVEKFHDSLKKLIAWMKENAVPFFEGISFGDVASTAGGLGLVYALIKASKAFDKVVNLFPKISGVLGQVSKTLIAYQRDLNASAILKIAGAIAILAVSLTILSFAKTDNLLNSALALSLIAGVLFTGASALSNALAELKKAFTKGKPVEQALNTFAAGLKSMMTKLGEAAKIKAVGSAIKDVAISLAIVAVVIVGLGYLYKKDKEMIAAGLDLVEYLLIIITGIMVAMTFMGEALKSGTKGFATAAAGMLALMFSVIILLKAVEKLFKMELPSKSEVNQKLGILGVLFVGLGVLAVLIGAAGRIAGGQKLSGGTFLGMASLIYLTVASLKKLFEMNIPDDMSKRLGILAGLFIGLGSLMLAIGYASKISGGNSLKALGTLVGITIFLAVAVGALMILSIFPGEKLLKGAISLGLVLVALGAALWGAGKITKKDTYKEVLAMAVAVAAITVALGVLSTVKGEKLLKAVVALDAVLIGLSLALYSAGKNKNAESVTGIIAMCIAVGVIAASLYTLSEMPWENLLASAVSISAVLLAFGKTFEMIIGKRWGENNVKKITTFLMMTLAIIPIGYALSKLSEQPWQGMIASGMAISAVILSFGKAFQLILEEKYSKDGIKKMENFLIMTIALIPIGLALYSLSNQPWDGLLAAAGALSATILAMSIAFRILAGSDDVNLGKIASFVLACVALYPITDGLAKLSGYDWKNLLASAGSLSMVLLAITASLAILGTLNIDPGTAIQAALALDAFVVVLGGLMLALGALFTQQIVPLDGVLDKGIEILIKIGNGLGQFIGAFIGGIGEGIIASFPEIAESLSQGMENLKPFINIAGSIPDGILGGCASLSSAIVLLTGIDILNAIGNFLSGGQTLSDLGKEMSSFGISIMPFISSLLMIRPEAIEACKGLSTMIVALTASQVINGIGSIFGLSGSLADFGKELSAFGVEIRIFAFLVKDISPESVQGAASAAKIMSEIANNLPSQGGLAAVIFGERSLAEFGKELVPFGIQMRIFSAIVKSIDPSSVIGAATAAEIMSKIANGLPSTDSLMSKIFGGGQMTLSEFGTELVAFAIQMRIFSGIVKDIKTEALNGTIVMTSIMLALRDNMPERSGWLDKIFGGDQMSLAEFAKELTKFATEMNKFSISASGFSLKGCNNLIEGFTALLNLSNQIGDNSATSIVNFAQQLGSIGTESINNFTSAFSNATATLNKSMGEFVTMTLTSLAAAMLTNGYLATDSVMKLCQSIVTQFKLSLPDVTTIGIGSGLISKISIGMSNKKPDITNNAIRIATGVITEFKNGLSQTKTIPIGENAAMGLSKGIENKINEVAQAAIRAAKAAVDAAKRELDVHSPSRVFFGIGENVTLGFANGIVSLIGYAKVASEEMSKTTLDPVTDMLSNLEDILQNEDAIDIQPRIVPVLDISNVKTGSKEIQDLFNKSTIDLSGINRSIQSAAVVFNGAKAEINTKEKKEKETVTNNFFNMEQNNYSPKYLSRSDIYRQTDNLFSALERKVGNKA